MWFTATLAIYGSVISLYSQNTPNTCRPLTQQVCPPAFPGADPSSYRVHTEMETASSASDVKSAVYAYVNLNSVDVDASDVSVSSNGLTKDVHISCDTLAECNDLISVMNKRALATSVEGSGVAVSTISNPSWVQSVVDLRD